MRSVLFGLLLAGAVSSAHALESITLVYGEGNNVNVFGLEPHSSEWRRWPVDGRWELSAYGMASVAYWRAREETLHKQLWDFAVAPVIRMERASGGETPYFEASLGAHYLSAQQINGNRAFSTNFQFGEFVAAGLRFGSQHRLEVSLRLQHVSNGGIRNPNPGLTFVSLALGCHL